jgi:hypothetical protein
VCHDQGVVVKIKVLTHSPAGNKWALVISGQCSITDDNFTLLKSEIIITAHEMHILVDTDASTSKIKEAHNSYTSMVVRPLIKIL